MKQNKPKVRAGTGDSDFPSATMSATERRASTALASIFMLRMLGLFMIFPVLSLHAGDYDDSTPLLIGLAISVYGLTQATFQIPFGMLSDRIGRKAVITAGLLIFALGCVMAAMADTMLGVVAGRAVQGVGAIAAAVMALTADLTREEHRAKAMGIIGVSIGLAFVVAQVIGPAVTGAFGLGGLFWLTGVLALAGIAVLHLGVPDAPTARFHRDTEPVLGQFSRVLRDRQLRRLNGTVMILHLVMTANTVVVPLALRDRAGVPEGRFWLVYLTVLAVSVVLMVPTILYGERRSRLKEVLVGSVLVLAVSQAGFAALHAAFANIVLMLTVYFYAFNLLEATLPALVSRLSPPELKGTSLAAYATTQYLGAFIGGPLGAWLYAHFGMPAVFATCAVVVSGWLVVVSGIDNPPTVATHILHVGPVSEARAQELRRGLLGVAGVSEAVVVVEEGVAYLKVDTRCLDREALRAFSAPRA